LRYLPATPLQNQAVYSLEAKAIARVTSEEIS
jgi:hypothetical protein